MVNYLSRFGHQVTVLTHSYRNTVFGGHPGEIRTLDISHNVHRTRHYWLLWAALRGWVEVLNRCGIYASIYGWWKRETLKHAEKIIAQAAPDVILATYPPVENLEIGIQLSQRFQIPLVADFRDGLLFDPIEMTRLKQYECIRRAYRRIEQETAQQASVVLTVSPPITAYFTQTYPCAHVVTVFNSFDAEDEEARVASIELDAGLFHIVHTGRFGGSYSGRKILPFLNALRKVCATHGEIRNRLRLHLVGQLTTQERALIQDLIAEGVIVVHNLVDRATAHAFQRAADLLLLLTAVNRESMVTAKLLEYLQASRPILALTSNTYAETIVRTTGAGWVCHPEHEEEIAQLLYNILSDRAYYRALTPRAERIEEFSSEVQMSRLNAILCETH